MKINVAQTLKLPDGSPIRDTPAPDSAETTLRKALTSACFATFQGDTASGDEKFKRWKIAQKVDAAESEVELSVEEVSLVKKLVGHVYPTAIVGAVWSILEK